MKQADRRTLERAVRFLVVDCSPTAQRLAEELRAMLAPKRTRTTAPRAKRSTPRRSERVRDRDFLLWVRTQPCLLREYDAAHYPVPGLRHACEGPIEAHHAGRRPLGRKCSDREAISLCRRAHELVTNGGLPREERRALERWAIQKTQAAFAVASALALGAEAVR